MKILCLSGLGADKRAFKNLELKDAELIHLEWPTPDDRETLKEYAARIARNINADQPCALLGISFGGMVAVEIAKLIKPKLFFLISSLLIKDELPLRYRLAGNSTFLNIFPVTLFTKANWLSYFLFGVTTKENKQLLKQILADTDPIFLRWALKAMISWKNTAPVPCIWIHGTNDHILPINRNKVDYVIQGGGHFMIANKASELARIINHEMAEIDK